MVSEERLYELNNYRENDDKGKLLICEIDFGDTILESISESPVLNTSLGPKYGNCAIYVYPDEGDYLAHFHIIGQTKVNGEFFNSCIRINSANYFSHGKHKSTFKGKSAKILDEKLREINPKTGVSYWETIKRLYYSMNPNCKEPQAEEQPNYKSIGRG